MSEIRVTLPDGSSRSLQNGARVYDLAASIGAGLAKASLAGKINGNLVDLSAVLPDDAHVEIITGNTINRTMTNINIAAPFEITDRYDVTLTGEPS